MEVIVWLIIFSWYMQKNVNIVRVMIRGHIDIFSCGMCFEGSVGPYNTYSISMVSQR